MQAQRPRRRRRAPWLTRVLVIAAVLALATAVVWVPYRILGSGTRDAQACLATFTSARGPQPPDCRHHASSFSLPSRLPWTRTRATYRAEELRARIAIAEYVDATVGDPNPEVRARAVPPLIEAQALVERGSGRLVLEDLGRAVPAPRLGHQAAWLGDRRTLKEHFERWSFWHVRLQALEAALQDGDLDAAKTFAARYAEFDPRDADVRVAAGAVLCLTGEPVDGLALLDRVPKDRAEGRHANFARHFGEVWMLIEACSGLAGRVAPEMPPTTSAGVADATEGRAVQRIRLSLRKEQELSRALDYAEVLLGSKPSPEGPGLAPTARGARATLLASLVAHAPDLTAESAADLARPRTAEEEDSPLGPGRVLSTADLWSSPRGLHHPELDPATLQRAADRMLAWTEPQDEDDEQSSLGEKDRRTLRRAAGALLLRAAVHEARAGRAKQSAALFRRGGELTSRSAVATSIAIAAAHRLAGKPEPALQALLAATPPGERPEDNLAAVVRAAWLQQTAETMLVLGRLEEARTRAVEADLAAEQAGDPTVAVRARWTRLVAARVPEDAVRDAAPRSPTPFLQVGFADRDARWARAGHDAHLRALTGWRDAIFATPERQLALRYAALDVRGDASDAFVAQLIAATRLLNVHDRDVANARSAAIELWLDAFGAIDARRMSMRAYAWSRAEAARARGDVSAATAWADAQAKLAAVAGDPARAEIARYLRL